MLRQTAAFDAENDALLDRALRAETERDALLKQIGCATAEDGVKGIQGLQDRVRFTESFESVRFHLHEADRDIARVQHLVQEWRTQGFDAEQFAQELDAALNG